MRESIVLGIAVGLLLVSCTTSAITPSATVTTLAPDAERWFRLTWEPVPESDGARVRLRGYLENTYGEAVGRVQLLAQALDRSHGCPVRCLPSTASTTRSRICSRRTSIASLSGRTNAENFSELSGFSRRP